MIKTRHKTPYRCAVYFAPPPESPWGQVGRQWLGRCSATGQRFDLPDIEGVDPVVLDACVAEPRRYGWHATLKAPFALAPGKDVASLVSSLQLLAHEHDAFTLPAMKVGLMGQFLALRPEHPHAELQNIAADCVTRLQHLALPLDEAELARRRRVFLTPDQDRLLQDWGYPWVLDHFRFHFSLTGKLDALPTQQSAALEQAAKRHFEDLGPCHFDRLSLFVEPQRGADFQLIEQVELRG